MIEYSNVPHDKARQQRALHVMVRSIAGRVEVLESLLSAKEMTKPADVPPQPVRPIEDMLGALEAELEMVEGRLVEIAERLRVNLSRL